MRLAHTRLSRRTGFTLVELLVVIAIIALLVALTVGAVIQWLNKVPVVNTTNDISQLSVALENFKSKFGCYPPSRIRLGRLPTVQFYPRMNTLGSYDEQSIAYLKQIWPRLWSPNPLNGAVTPVDWSAGTQQGFQRVDLEGDQCLVYFLGGVPQIDPAGIVAVGFSTDPVNPAQQPSTTLPGRVGPFFNFAVNRLVDKHGNIFRSYTDSYDKQQVFAYFSSGKRPNDYNRYFNDQDVAIQGTSDCKTLGVWPYAEFIATQFSPAADRTKPPRYLNADKYQIISAGRDGVFGAGTQIARVTGTFIFGATFGAPPTAATWAPNNPDPMGKANLNFKDDQSNFASGILAAGG